MSNKTHSRILHEKTKQSSFVKRSLITNDGKQAWLETVSENDIDLSNQLITHLLGQSALKHSPYLIKPFDKQLWR